MPLLVSLYFIAILILCIFGAHRAWLLYLLRSRPLEQRNYPALTQFPSVCVQLPIYNELAVAARVIQAASELTYPRGQLEIQVLDDSDDLTREIVDREVARLKSEGLNINIFRRERRIGFKAGALSEALKHTDAKFIAIFDADFVPAPDFLLKTLPGFSSEDVAFVQARWEFLNRNQNWFTRAQAILLDGHFFIEHAARYSADLCFNFNGTAGVWSRSALQAAGGWQADTLTEDLDLSYRAQLLGYRGVYLRDYSCMSELPETIAAFKSQQYRWSKGTLQVFRKLIGKLLRSNMSATKKKEAIFHLAAPFSYIAGLLIALLMVPVNSYRIETYSMIGAWFEPLAFVLTLGSLFCFYWSSQQVNVQTGSAINCSVPGILSAIVLGIGITANCARAVLDGLLTSQSGDFIRTPKSGSAGKAHAVARISPGTIRTLLQNQNREFLLALYLTLGMLYLCSRAYFLSLPFVLLILLGYASICMLHFLPGSDYE